MPVVEPLLSQAFVPLSPDGCSVAHDFGKVALPAYSNNADKDSSLFIRFYNEAIEKWVKEMIVIDGVPIFTMKSSPMRAFSSYRHLRKPSDTNPLPPDAEQPERPPLPMANYIRGTPKPNKSLQQSSYPIRNIGFMDSTKKRRTAYTRYPKASLIPYTIEFWCRYDSHMDYILQKIYEQFTPSIAYYEVGSPFSNGTILMPIHMLDMVDNSDLERDNVDDRLFRTTLTVEVEAWMFYNINQAPTFQTETDQIAIASDKALTNTEDVFVKSTKFTDLAPLTVEERAATISNDIPKNQA